MFVDSIIIIADDLTGANDTAAQFAKLGYRTAVSISEYIDFRRMINNYQVISINTESRALTQEKAYNKVFTLGKILSELDTNIAIYKKIDSTLRGNITAEIKAIYDSYKPDLIIFTPAYPKQKRITINGVHLVNGEPVTQTFYGKDPRTPVKSSYIPDYFSNTFGDYYHHAPLNEVRSGEILKLLDNYKVLSFDVENDSDLKMIVEKITRSSKHKIVWVGSAGLAEYVAYMIVVKGRSGKPILVGVGSLNEVTRNQIKYLLQTFNCVIIKIDVENLIKKKDLETDRVISFITNALKDSNIAAIIVTTSYDMEQVRQGEKIAKTLGVSMNDMALKIADTFGDLLANIISTIKEKFSGIFLTGGDIVSSVLKHLNISVVEIKGEIEPGLPILSFNNTLLVTKAGGFGSETTIMKVVGRLGR
jgi:uncharacterized protein YgbK (DUF1537 family)